jgi:hypothetical protein
LKIGEGRGGGGKKEKIVRTEGFIAFVVVSTHSCF